MKSAIDLPDTATPTSTLAEPQEAETEPDTASESGIVTTGEEMEGFYAVKAILREVIDVGRIQFKDTKNYFGYRTYGYEI